MLHSITTKKSIDTIISEIQELVPKSGFSILHHYDFQTILEGKGFPIERKVWVFEICRASLASNMLTHFPLFSVMMPCRISIYEDAGITHIATIDMLPMLDSIKDNAELHQEAKILYGQLMEMMKTLCG